MKASQYETDEITTGIDVSEFQGNIDWKAVADSGIDFAMIRVGYRGMKNGEIKEDACAKYNLQEASKNGLKIRSLFLFHGSDRGRGKRGGRMERRICFQDIR